MAPRNVLKRAAGSILVATLIDYFAKIDGNRYEISRLRFVGVGLVLYGGISFIIFYRLLLQFFAAAPATSFRDPKAQE